MPTYVGIYDAYGLESIRPATASSYYCFAFRARYNGHRNAQAFVADLDEQQYQEILGTLSKNPIQALDLLSEAARSKTQAPTEQLNQMIDL